MVTSGVARTAYLVNESRHRRLDLSGDRLAESWVEPELRAEVRAMWDGYAREVYRHDDLVVSLRGAAVAGVVARALERAPDLVLVSVGAGFTSYPWLLPVQASLELDLASVVDVKRRRARQLEADGVLPERSVTHTAIELGGATSLDALVATVDDFADGRPTVLVVEGLVYYLDVATAEGLVELPRRLAPGCVGAVVSYWPDTARSNPVLARQAGWFRSHGIAEESTFLATDRVETLLGGRATTRGPEDLQRDAGLDPIVAEADLVPEYVTEMEA